MDGTLVEHHRPVQAGHGHRLRRHLGLSPAGADPGQHRRSPEHRQPPRQSALARGRRRRRSTGPWPSASAAASAASCCAATPTSRRPSTSTAGTPTRGVRFIFGYDAHAQPEGPRRGFAGQRPGSRLQRPARYDGQDRRRGSGRTTSRTDRGRGAAFENHAPASRRRWPSSTTGRRACRQDVPHGGGPQEHLGGERRDSCCSIGSCTSSTSPTTGSSEADEIVFSANDRCDQENLLAQLQRRRAGVDGAGGQPGEQLGVHGDDGVGLEPEGVVGADAAGAARPLAGEAPGGEALGAAAGVQDVRERLRASAVPDRPAGRQVGVSACWAGTRTSRSSSAWWTCCGADAGIPEVGVRMLRSPRHPKQKCREKKKAWPNLTWDEAALLWWKQREDGAYRPQGVRRRWGDAKPRLFKG